MAYPTRLDDLIPRTETLQFLTDLGESLNSRCAILHYPSEEQCRILDEHSEYLQEPGGREPNEETLLQMWKSLEDLGYKKELQFYGSSEFCENLRLSHLADLRCAYCNYTHAKEAYKRGTSVRYVCHAGLWDIVAPIVIADRHVADIFIGQNHRDLRDAEIHALHSKYKLGKAGVSIEGLVEAYNNLRRKFYPDEAGIVRDQRLSSRASLLAELARLFSDYATKRLTDVVFSELWTSVRAYQTANEIMAQVMRTLRQYASFDSSGVWIRNPSRPGWLTCLYADYSLVDDPDGAKGMREDEGLGGRVMTSGKTLHLPSADEVASIPVPRQCEAVRQRRNLKTFLAVPLRHGRELTGLVEIGAQRERAFWPGTVVMMEDVARYLSVFFSLRNEMAQDSLRTTDLTGAQRLPGVARYLVTELPEVTGCLACSVFWVSDDGQSLECAATTGIVGHDGHPRDTRPRYSVGANQLTSWVFRHQKTVRFTSREKAGAEQQTTEIASLPQYREKILGPSGAQLSADECDKLPVIMAPIILSGVPQGVLRIVGRVAGGAFTEEEQSLVEQLARTMAHPDSVRRSVVRILDVVPALVGVLDARLLYQYFLTLVTHGDAVGLNRAILFDYDPFDRSLHPVAAIGPASPDEARSFATRLAQELPSLRSCFAQADKVAAGPPSPLLASLPPSIVVDCSSAMAKLVCRKEPTVAVEEASAELLMELQRWVPSLGIESALCCTIQVRWRDQLFLLVCDNVYDAHNRFSPGQASLLSVVASLFQRGVHLLAREHDFDSLRSKSWRQAVDTIAHNLGNKLFLIEDGLAKAIEEPSRLKDEITSGAIEQRIRSAMRDVRDLRRADLPVEPNQLLSTTKLLEAIEKRLKADTAGRAELRIYAKDCEEADIVVDFDRIVDCFSALAHNAIQAMPTGLVLKLEASVTDPEDGPAAEPGSDGERRSLRIQLADNGPGIPVATKRRIFEPYYSGREGEGLGLSFVAHVVKLHQGFVEEIGEPGKGAIFSIKLPLRVAVERSPEHPARAFVPDLPRNPPTAPAGKVWRTLVVEDDDYVAWKLVECFRGLEVANRPFALCAVRSIGEYLELQKKHLFDVVILDVSLFEKWTERARDLTGGLDIAEYLQIWNANAVVVIYSASLTVDVAVRAMRSGAYDCVDKTLPGSLAKLVRSVQEGIENTWSTHEAVGKMLESLSADFAGKYVAVMDGQVLGVNASLHELKSELRRQRPNCTPTIVHVAESV